jgi:hypothetical protein
MGWAPKIAFRDGVADAYRAFLDAETARRARQERQPA